MFDQHHISAVAWELFTDSCRKRRFGSTIATVYKTDEILKICTFAGSIGRRLTSGALERLSVKKHEKTQDIIIGGIFFILVHVL